MRFTKWPTSTIQLFAFAFYMISVAQLTISVNRASPASTSPHHTPQSPLTASLHYPPSPQTLLSTAPHPHSSPHHPSPQSPLTSLASHKSPSTTAPPPSSPHPTSSNQRANFDTTESVNRLETNADYVTTSSSSSDTDQEAYRRLTAYLVGNAIVTYCSPVIVISGIAGNVLSMLIMWIPSNRGSSFCVYLAVLALTDNGSLLAWAYRWYLITSGDPVSNLECKLDIGAKYAFRIIGYWLIILITIDRFIAVKYPVKAVTWCNAKNALIVSLISFILGFFYALPYFYLGRSKGYKCSMRDKTGRFSLVYQWSLIIFGLLFPIFVISTLNTKIFLSIRSRVKYRAANDASSPNATTATTSTRSDRTSDSTECDDGNSDAKSGANFPSSSRANADNTTNNSSSPTKTYDVGLGRSYVAATTYLKSKRKPLTKQDRRLVNILLIVTLTFVLLNTPQVLRGAVNYMKTSDTARTDAGKAAVHFAWAFTNTLSTINYAINFYLYCLSSRKFRNDLSYLLGNCCKLN